MYKILIVLSVFLAAAWAESEAEAEADPYLAYSAGYYAGTPYYPASPYYYGYSAALPYYGGGLGAYHVVGKRSADPEPEPFFFGKKGRRRFRKGGHRRSRKTSYRSRKSYH